MRLLGQIETHSPEIVAKILALPHVGSWAIDCLRKMPVGNGAEQADAAGRAPLRLDLGYLVAVAAAAALRARHQFDLMVPLRDGVLLLPGLGTARLDSREPWGSARVRLDGNGALASSGASAVALPTGLDPAVRADPRWLPTPRLRARAGGLALNVALDPLDPFLSRVGEPVAALSTADLAEWELRAGEAWRILVGRHRTAAEVLAAVVSTVVPLAGRTSQPTSATSGWAFGVIGLSLPASGLSLAETFVHELHHLVLGAVEDLVPLVDHERDDRLGYAPWRDDPRPAAGLLHGCYAHLGITEFWRRQRHVGGSERRLRGAVEFARWRRATLGTAAALAASSALTAAGARFVAGIQQELTGWQDDILPEEAERLAAEARLDHWVRWRLACARPAAGAIDALARAWQSSDALPRSRIRRSGEEPRRPDGPVAAGLAPGGAAVGRAGMPVTIEPPPRGARHPPASQEPLAPLLAARYRDPARLSRLLDTSRDAPGQAGVRPPVDEADAALLRGDDATAARCYLRRLEYSDDADAWAGLAIVLRRTGPPAPARLLRERPEVAAAVHARLHALIGKPPNVLRLLGWLADAVVLRADHSAGAGESDRGASGRGI